MEFFCKQQCVVSSTKISITNNKTKTFRDKKPLQTSSSTYKNTSTVYIYNHIGATYIQQIFKVVEKEFATLGSLVKEYISIQYFIHVLTA